jgi:putative acetyltransferase
MLSIKIELLENVDEAQIIGLILPIQQIEHRVPVTIEDQPDLLDIEKYYHQTGGGFWGVKHQGKIIGTIALIKMREKQGGVIRKMFVKKEFRGKELSIAQHLLDYLINYARNNGITDLYLGTVDLLKAAIRFYEKNHFIRIEKNALPPNFPLVKVDNTFYHLKLSTPNNE